MVEVYRSTDEDRAQPTVSIIVACKEFDPYVLQCINESKKLDFRNFELIILPDSEPEEKEAGVRIIPTGPIPPSQKRNIGAGKSRGEILAFLDGDAYPARDWLRNAVQHLRDNSVPAVGGPSITPETDKIMQKASGEILSSYFGSGPMSLRNSKKSARRCDDLPSVNLVVRKESFDRIGGFDSSFWPGEDSKFCRDLAKEEGTSLLYAPDVQVFHHRRALFRPHLKQIAGYGLHRGYFSKRFPENSRKITYFIPAALVLAIATSVALLFTNGILSTFAVAFLGFYLAILLIGASMVGLRRKNARLASVVFLGTIATHICYGAFFLKGLLSRNLAR